MDGKMDYAMVTESVWVHKVNIIPADFGTSLLECILVLDLHWLLKVIFFLKSTKFWTNIVFEPKFSLKVHLLNVLMEQFQFHQNSIGFSFLFHFVILLNENQRTELKIIQIEVLF